MLLEEVGRRGAHVAKYIIGPLQKSNVSQSKEKTLPNHWGEFLLSFYKKKAITAWFCVQQSALRHPRFLFLLLFLFFLLLPVLITKGLRPMPRAFRNPLWEFPL